MYIYLRITSASGRNCRRKRRLYKRFSGVAELLGLGEKVYLVERGGSGDYQQTNAHTTARWAEVIMSNRVSERFNIREWFTVSGITENHSLRRSLPTINSKNRTKAMRQPYLLPLSGIRPLSLGIVRSVSTQTATANQAMAHVACVNVTFMIILQWLNVVHSKPQQILYGKIEYAF